MAKGIKSLDLTFKVVRLIENKSETGESSTVLLEPDGDIKCSRVVLKFTGTPEKPIEEMLGFDPMIGDTMAINMATEIRQSKLGE